MDKNIKRAKVALDMLLTEANILRRARGKAFLSKKDIKQAWFVVDGLMHEDMLEHANSKTVFAPKMGMAEVDRIIDKIIKQERTGIKIKSMQWSVSKSTRNYIYNLTHYMEEDAYWIKKK